MCMYTKALESQRMLKPSLTNQKKQMITPPPPIPNPNSIFSLIGQSERKKKSGLETH